MLKTKEFISLKTQLHWGALIIIFVELNLTRMSNIETCRFRRIQCYLAEISNEWGIHPHEFIKIKTRGHSNETESPTNDRITAFGS